MYIDDVIRTIKLINSLPKHAKLVLLSIISLAKIKRITYTEDAYELYSCVCKISKIKPLTNRRVKDLIAELDLLGLINTKLVKKKGRVRKEIKFVKFFVSSDELKKIILDLGLDF